MPNSQPIVKINNSSLTPWSTNVNASGYVLQNVGAITIAGGFGQISGPPNNNFGMSISQGAGRMSGLYMPLATGSYDAWIGFDGGVSNNFAIGVSHNENFQITHNVNDVTTSPVFAIQWSNGAIGVGTSSPARLLTIASSLALGGALTQTVRLQRLDGTTVCGGALEWATGNGTVNFQIEVGLTSQDMRFNTADSAQTRMVLTQTGNLCIGTTAAPASAVATLCIGVGAAPTANPSGFCIYVDPADSKLKIRGSSGTVATLAVP